MKYPAFTPVTSPAYHQLPTVPVFFSMMLSPDGAGFNVLDVLEVLEVVDVDEVLEVLDVLDVLEVLEVVEVLEVLEVDGVGGTTSSSKLPPKSN